MRRNKNRYDRNEKVARYGIGITTIGFLIMVVPIIMWSQTVGVSLWAYVLPILLGAVIAYSGVQILNDTDVWWWN